MHSSPNINTEPMGSGRISHAEMALRLLQEALDGYEPSSLSADTIESLETEHMMELVDEGYFTDEEAAHLLFEAFRKRKG